MYANTEIEVIFRTRNGERHVKLYRYPPQLNEKEWLTESGEGMNNDTEEWDDKRDAKDDLKIKLHREVQWLLEEI